MRVLGYVEFSAGQAAAGVWVTAPSKVQLYGVGVNKPGDSRPWVGNASGAVATGTTAIPADDTIPQITEGNEFMTQAITPSKTTSLLEIEHMGYYASTVTNEQLSVALFQDATANALAAGMCARDAASGGASNVTLKYLLHAGTVAATTFRIRVGSASGATTTFNGVAGGRIFGGVMNSILRVREIFT